MFEAATIQTMPQISWGQRETSAAPGGRVRGGRHRRLFSY